jgi:LAO/AO transport system kinase
VPGLGDDIQIIKAGIMEIGDVFVVNKADRDGADRVVREIRLMLEMAAGLALDRGDAAAAAHHRELAGAATGPGAGGLSGRPLAEAGVPPMPPVLKTVAETGEGCAALVDAVIAHRDRLAASGALEARRVEAARSEMRSLIAFRILDALEGEAGRAAEDSLARSVALGEIDPYSAAEELLAALSRKE